MKSALVFVALFAYAQSAALENEIASPERHFENIELHLQAQSDRSDFQNEDQLIATLNEFEKTHDRNVVADALNKLLEDLRVVIINGNDDLPPLDPFHLEHIGPLGFSTTGVRVSANINDLETEGLRWFVVDSVSVSALQLTVGFRVTVPRLTVTGNYDANAIITFLSHSAGGNFRIFMNRLEVTTECRLGTSIFGGFLFLRNLDINIVLHDISIQIQGMVGSTVLNALINSYVQNTAQTIIRDELQNVSKDISEMLFDTIDNVLRQFTLNDLINNRL